MSTWCHAGLQRIREELERSWYWAEKAKVLLFMKEPQHVLNINDFDVYACKRMNVCACA